MLVYFDVVLKFSKAIEQPSHWAESCPCHEDLQLATSFQRVDQRGGHGSEAHFRRVREQLHSMSQGEAETCVVRAKGLPELVADGLDL